MFKVSFSPSISPGVAVSSDSLPHCASELFGRRDSQAAEASLISMFFTSAIRLKRVVTD